VCESDRIMGLKMTKTSAFRGITASLLVLILVGRAPCPCQERCSFDLECVNDASSPPCCEHHSQQKESAQNSPSDGCCCGHGLCNIEAAKLPTVQCADLGLELVGANVSTPGFFSRLLQDREKRDPFVRLILPNLKVGYLLPELSSLLI